MKTKKCFKCGKEKEINKFYSHPMMGDGKLGKCKECTKKDVAERYSDPEARERIREYERKRFKDPERKAKLKIYVEVMRQKNRGKWRARQKLARAVENGTVKRLPCEVCGEAKSQAHHTDYRKALDVKWLCFRHHREAHGQIVGTISSNQC